MSKICTKCKTEYKNTKKNFPNKSTPNHCRACINISMKKYFRGVNGVVTKIYNSQKRISDKYNHDFPFYTKAEFKEWLINQKKFQEIYDFWVNNNHDRWLAPHCARINKSEPFKFDNLFVCTWKIGYTYGMKHKKLNGIKVVKYTLRGEILGEILGEYESVASLYRNSEHEIDVTYESFKNNIKKCLSGELDSYNGFKYKGGNENE